MGMCERLLFQKPKHYTLPSTAVYKRTCQYAASPDPPPRLTSSATRRCSSLCVRMMERYCGPTSLPWRLGVVGSCSVKKIWGGGGGGEGGGRRGAQGQEQGQGSVRGMV